MILRVGCRVNIVMWFCTFGLRSRVWVSVCVFTLLIYFGDVLILYCTSILLKGGILKFQRNSGFSVLVYLALGFLFFDFT